MVNKIHKKVKEQRDFAVEFGISSQYNPQESCFLQEVWQAQLVLDKGLKEKNGESGRKPRQYC